MGLYVLLPESLSTCDNLDLIICSYTLYSLGPHSMQYCNKGRFCNAIASVALVHTSVSVSVSLYLH